MYHDHCLRFADEMGAKGALAFAVLDGRWIVATHDFALDPIGLVVLEQGTYDDEGNQLTEPVFADGFHVNLRVREGFVLPDLSAFTVYPQKPRRVWA